MSTSAGVFFYSNTTDRYLYLLRTDNKNPGNWGIPGGKIEEDETLFEGIARECEEEISFFPKHAKLIPIQKAVPAKKPTTVAPPKTLASTANLSPVSNIAGLTSLVKKTG